MDTSKLYRSFFILLGITAVFFSNPQISHAQFIGLDQTFVDFRFDGKGPSQINVDDLSDQQIKDAFDKALSKGYSENEIYFLLEQNGMSQLELNKLRARYDDIQRQSEELIETTADELVLIEESLESEEAETEADSLKETGEQQDYRDANTSEEVYGKSIFRDGNITFFQKTIDFEAPDHYILGVGDKISVSIWGYSDFSGNYTIQPWGGITDKDIDRVYLRGLTWRKAKSLLRARFEKVYNKTNSQYEITLSYTREVSVGIVGEVQKPGTYSIPAINSAFNALTVSEGPNNIGSLRNIRIIRDNKIIKALDVYRYLQNPSSDDQFYMENGDVIMVPISEKTVQLSGEVKRPMKYQLKGDEGLIELIEFAGGTKNTAYLENIHIERFTKDWERVVIDTDLDSLISNGINFPLQDGDKIFINPIPLNVENHVEITGSVGIPGKYEYIPNERVLSLLQRASGLNYDTYLDVAYLTRIDTLTYEKHIIALDLNEITSNPKSKQNMLLKQFDKIRIFSKRDFVNEYSIEVIGAVQNPSVVPFANGMRLSDAINLCKGLEDDALMSDAYVIRKVGTSTFYLQFSPEKVIADQSADDNILLQEKDIVRVFSQDEFKDEYDIQVIGAVRNPKRFVYSEEMTLYDALTLCGGLLFDSDLRVEISRLNLNNNEVEEISSSVFVDIELNEGKIVRNEKTLTKLKPFDKVFVRRKFDAKISQTVTVVGEVKFPGVYSILNKNETVSDLIRRAGGLTEVASPEAAVFYREEDGLGEVVFNLKKAVNKPKSSQDYQLVDGDQISIPGVQNFVSIKGAIDYPISEVRAINAPYQGGKSAKWYINHYGSGFSKEAKRKRTYVIQPNGDIDRTSTFLFMNFYPKVKAGGNVYALEKQYSKEKREKKSEPVDWNQAIENFTVKMTGLLTLWLLVERVTN